MAKESITPELMAKIMKEWMDKGNTITQIPQGQRTDPADLKPQWGKPRPKKKGPEKS
jgi:hypothetical protein